jgi:hypothetical protein
MARQPELEINGVKYDHIYSVKYSLYTSRDERGAPTSSPRAGLIKITRQSDGKQDIAEWAAKSGEGNWKDGTITFKSPKGEEWKKISWTKGYVVYYEEELPHTGKQPNDQIAEYFEISATIVTIGEGEPKVDNEWQLA